MAILKILEFPDPRLRTIAKPVAHFDAALLKLVDDMIETMYEADGVGLAATQVDVHKRLLVIDVSEDRNEPLVFVNPEITVLDDSLREVKEGCLSVPGMRGIVPRWSRIRYTGFDQYGDLIDREADDFHARVVQHECDHLWGMLYPMRMTNMAQFGFTEVLFPGIAAAEDD
jgi:peptide deformylase